MHITFITKGLNICNGTDDPWPNCDKMFLLFQILKFYFIISAKVQNKEQKKEQK